MDGKTLEPATCQNRAAMNERRVADGDWWPKPCHREWMFCRSFTADGFWPRRGRFCQISAGAVSGRTNGRS